MRQKNEYNFRTDLHGKVGTSPAGIWISYKTGDVVKLSWEVVRKLLEHVNRKDRARRDTENTHMSN